MATLKGQTIAASYQDLVKRADSYSQPGTNIELMTDTDSTIAPTGLYLESGATTSNVGIGTASPDHILDIEESNAGVDGSATQIRLYNTGAGDTALRFSLSAQDWWVGVDNSDSDKFKIGTASTWAGAGTRFCIDTSGKVGIGVADPNNALEVLTATSATKIEISCNNGGTSELLFSDVSASGRGRVYFDHGSTPEGLKFESAGTLAMTIDNAGKVGIGTAAPEGKFHVDAGDAGDVTASVYADEMIVETDTDGGISVLSPDANWGALSFGSPGADVNALIASNYNSGNQILRFYVGGQSSGDMKMIINSSGNVGIGATPEAWQADYTALQIGGNAAIIEKTTDQVSNPLNILQNVYFDGNWKKIIGDESSRYVQLNGQHTFMVDSTTGDPDDVIDPWVTSMILDTNSRISLSNNDAGGSNTVFGYLAGAALTVGAENNVLIGDNAGNDLTTGDQNVIIGHLAGDALVGGDDNTFIGQSAGGVTTAGAAMVIIGRNAGLADITADAAGTVAVGANSLQALTSGQGNVAIGYQALDAETIGDFCTAVGYQALSAQVGIDGKVANTAVGHQAGLDITSGQYNTLLGYLAGANLTTMNHNTAIGTEALTGSSLVDQCVVIGSQAGTAAMTADADGTVAVGYSALQLLTSGQRNVAVGYSALTGLTTGDYNTALGWGAADAFGADEQENVAVGNSAMGGFDEGTNGHIDGNVAVGSNAFLGADLSTASVSVIDNIAIGRSSLDATGVNAQTGTIAIGGSALTALTSGGGNTAIGYLSADAMTDGYNNVALGHSSLGASVSGRSMVALGYGALGDGNITTAAEGTVGVGYGALAALTSGDGNVAVGYTAGAALTDGQYNTLLGYEAGLSLDGGASNVFVGWKAGRLQVEAGHCIAIGHNTLSNSTNTSSIENIAIGSNSLDAITSGVAIGNVCVGFDTGTAITTGDSNTCIGTDAGKAVTIGLSNTFVGTSAGDGTDDGHENTAVGRSALSANCGTGNTAIGKDAGEQITGGSNTVMGKSAGKSLTSGSNNLFLGMDSGLTGSPGGNITTGGNEIVLGDENITESHIQVDWTVASDERDKTDFTALDIGLDFVKELSPVTYKWDKRSKYGDKTADDYDLNAQSPDGTHKEDWLDIGFKAQEVEALEKAAGYKIADKTNLTTSLTGDGKQYGIQYSKFVPILVKAVQELSAEVESLKEQLNN